MNNISYKINSFESNKNQLPVLRWTIKTNGFQKIIIGEIKAKIYNASLAFILSSKNLSVNELNTNEETTIDGTKYLKTFALGYTEGEKYFKSNFAVTPNTIFGTESKTIIQTLMHHYCHYDSLNIRKGWAFVKYLFPTILNSNVIEEYGYFSGIVNQFDILNLKFPKLFNICNNCKVKSNDSNNDLVFKPDEDVYYNYPIQEIENEYEEIEEKLKSKTVSNQVELIEKYLKEKTIKFSLDMNFDELAKLIAKWNTKKKHLEKAKWQSIRSRIYENRLTLRKIKI